MEQENKWIRDIQRGGSRQAAENLVERYYDEIYVFVYRQTGHKEDAMDLTQSIFLAILRALSTYDPKKASFRTWLYRIAANKVIDARRQSRPVTTPLEEIELPVQEDFVSQIHNRELLERIEGYVSGLAPSLQAVFRLRLYGEQSFGEIAAALGQSEAAVKSQYPGLGAGQLIPFELRGAFRPVANFYSFLSKLPRLTPEGKALLLERIAMYQTGNNRPADSSDPRYEGPLCCDCQYCGDKYSFPIPNDLLHMDPENPILKHFYCCCGDCDLYGKDITGLGIHECEHFEEL